MTEEPLQQRMSERQLYETVVGLIVDAVNQEFPADMDARLRVYWLISENFSGMVRALQTPHNPSLLAKIEYGDNYEEPTD